MGKYRGIYRRGDIWWYRYADAKGKIQRRSSFSGKQADAVAARARVTTMIRDGLDPDASKKIPNHAFAQLIDRYTSWLTDRQASASVKTYILERLKERVLTLDGEAVKLGELSLRRFNTYVMEQLQTDLQRKELRTEKPESEGEEKKEQKGLSPAGNNKVMSTIKAMFTKAVEWEMVGEDTLKKVRKVKLFRETGRLRYLSAEEANSLVSVCEPHLQPIVVTALHTGMRKGEILGLTWDRVDLQHGFILLDKTKNGERREVPVNETLKRTLQALPRRIDCPYVFHDAQTLGRYLDVKRSFHSALERAKITDFHFHDLRHTYAALAIMSGEIDLPTLSKLLGHKTIKMTMRYAHLSPAHTRKAARVMDEVYRVRTDTQLAHEAGTETEKGLAYVS